MTAHSDYGTKLWIGECLALDDDNRLLLNPIIESGLVYSRVLLEFLGREAFVHVRNLLRVRRLTRQHADVLVGQLLRPFEGRGDPSILVFWLWRQSSSARAVV